MSRLLQRSLLAVTALVTIATGCSVNPVTGQKEVVFMSPQREAELGRQEAAKVAAQLGLVNDPAMTAYIRTLGNRLAAKSPRQDVQYQFFIADMPEPNAFALPGGYIYVSRGLLALSNSESELANVIGHEIGHVAARHAAQREARATGVGLATVLGTILAGVAGGGDAARTAAQLGQAAGAGLIASYGRNQERQADEIGQQLAAGSGWDPLGMSTFLATLERYTARQLGSTPRPGYLDSHPALGERVETNAARARELTVVAGQARPLAQGDFFRRFEGLLIGTDPKEGVFRDQRFLHADLGLRIDFPAGWKTQNTKAAVAAAPASRDGLVKLETQPGTSDPREAARAFVQGSGVSVVASRALTIAGFPAFRITAEGQQQSQQQGQPGAKVGVLGTWIAHRTGMLRILGLAPAARFSSYAPAFQATADSLRDLSADDRRQITEQRLAVAQARAGENLTTLGNRTKNSWSSIDTAIANDLADGTTLPAARAVKIAVTRPYAGTAQSGS